MEHRDDVRLDTLDLVQAALLRPVEGGWYIDRQDGRNLTIRHYFLEARLEQHEEEALPWAVWFDGDAAETNEGWQLRARFARPTDAIRFMAT